MRSIRNGGSVVDAGLVIGRPTTIAERLGRRGGEPDQPTRPRRDRAPLWEWRSDRYNERVGGISLRPHHACGSAQIARGLFRALLRYRGGLISYGPNYPDQYRRGAGYVDRIRKGEKPRSRPTFWCRRRTWSR